MTVRVVGVDGWKDGWVAAVLDGDRISWAPFPQRSGTAPRHAFADILSTFPTATIAIDIPIGVEGHSAVDADAARWLARHGGQRSSLFLTPAREVVQAYEDNRTHQDAMRASKQTGRPGTSIQAWHLIPKIVEVRDALVAGRQPVFEAHPECSFRLLDHFLRGRGFPGPPIANHSKKSARGAALRMRVLEQVFELPSLTSAPDTVPLDDLLDASVLAWTAQRYLEGAAHPGPPLVTIPDDAAGPPRIVI